MILKIKNQVRKIIPLFIVLNLLSLPGLAWGEKPIKICNKEWKKRFTQIKLPQCQKKVDELKINPLSWDWHVNCPKEHEQKKQLYNEARELHNELMWWYEKCRKETDLGASGYASGVQIMRNDLNIYRDKCIR